jgi:hypothetical protein
MATFELCGASVNWHARTAGNTAEKINREALPPFSTTSALRLDRGQHFTYRLFDRTKDPAALDDAIAYERSAIAAGKNGGHGGRHLRA